METPTDHDNLVTLIAEVKTLGKGQEELKKSQNDFHAEMRETLARMQDNNGNRITKLEERVANLEITRTDFREKLALNKTLLGIAVAVGMILIGLMSWHIIGYRI
jgi:seryl-tRNA synthetase